MIDTTTSSLLRTLPLVRAALAREYGWRWPLALARCVARSRTLVRQTRWAGRGDEEARLVRALAVIPAIYLTLRERSGARALEATRELAAALLAAANERLARDAALCATAGPRARWHAFFDHAVAHGVGAFNENECLSVEVECFHLRVRRCLFADIARDLGLPELARMACGLPVPFCRDLLPSHDFRRNGSLENTLAYGYPHCDYLWEPKDTPALCAGDHEGDADRPGDTELPPEAAERRSA